MLFSSLLVSFLLNYPFLVSLLLNLLCLKLCSGHCSQCNINPSFGFSLSLSLIASQSSICSQKWFTVWSPGTLKLLSLLPAPLPQPSSFSDTLRQLYYCPNWTILFWRVKGDTNQTWFWDKRYKRRLPLASWKHFKNSFMDVRSAFWIQVFKGYTCIGKIFRRMYSKLNTNYFMEVMAQNKKIFSILYISEWDFKKDEHASCV